MGALPFTSGHSSPPETSSLPNSRAQHSPRRLVPSQRSLQCYDRTLRCLAAAQGCSSETNASGRLHCIHASWGFVFPGHTTHAPRIAIPLTQELKCRPLTQHMNLSQAGPCLPGGPHLTLCPSSTLAASSVTEQGLTRNNATNYTLVQKRSSTRGPPPTLL